MIVVLTSPRDGASYLEQTLRQVEDQAPNEQKLLISHRIAAPVRDGWQALHVEHGHGNRKPFFIGLAIAAEFGDVIWLEDDIRLCKNALTYMSGFVVPAGLGWVQFFTPVPLRSGVGFGLHVGSPGSSRFLQAVKFSQAAAQAVCRSFRRRFDHEPDGSADQALASISKHLGMRWAAHAPDLAEHVGDVSAFGDGRRLTWFRKATDFRPDLDALSLR